RTRLHAQIIEESGARRRRRRKIHLENGHLKSVGDVAIFLIAEDDADEFAGNVDLDGVGLIGAFLDRDRVEAEEIAEVFFQAPDFAAGHGQNPPLRHVNWHAGTIRSRRKGWSGSPIKSGNRGIRAIDSFLAMGAPSLPVRSPWPEPRQPWCAAARLSTQRF